MSTKRYLFFDIESHNAGRQYGMTPREFFRLGQYAVNDGPVVLTEDYDEVLSQIEAADFIVGHNISAFDLPVLYGVESMRPLELALENRVIDTFVLATLVNPAPYHYVNKDGRDVFDGAEPKRAKKWFSLDEQAHQLGVPGKFGSLQALAKKYNPPKTLVANLDYGLIPLDDPDFRAYATQDVVALRDVYMRLRAMAKAQNYDGDYIWREMSIWALNAQITRNGWLVDQAEAQARVDALTEERERILEWLVENFDFPTEGKQPWKSDKGKGSIIKAFESFGIVPERNPTWARTAGGAPSFGGEVMIAISEGTEAEELGRALATLQGQRSLAQLALDSTFEDGRIHPEISCLQRSGRTSVEKPGLTVWTARGPGAVEKRYFIADPGSVLVEMDYSAADARAVAAVSGDEEFAKRFEPGVDAHDLTGVIFFGHEYYYANRELLRPLAKMGGHALAYRIGAKKLAAQLGCSVAEAQTYIDNYKATYRLVTRWQEKVTEEGDRGSVTNSWGRRMRIDPDRSFTQSSALIGQSTTREIMFDGLLRIARDRLDVIRWLRATVHDAVVWCIPKEEVEWAVPYILDKMQTTFDHGTLVGQAIHFPMANGPLDALNWYEAGH